MEGHGVEFLQSSSCLSQVLLIRPFLLSNSFVPDQCTCGIQVLFRLISVDFDCGFCWVIDLVESPFCIFFLFLYISFEICEISLFFCVYMCVDCSVNDFWRFGFSGFCFFFLIVVDLEVDGRKDVGSVFSLQNWKL